MISLCLLNCQSNPENNDKIQISVTIMTDIVCCKKLKNSLLILYFFCVYDDQIVKEEHCLLILTLRYTHSPGIHH